MASEPARRLAPTPRRTRTGPLIVEFIGTPGVGKTTLANQTRDVLRQAGTHAQTIVSAAREQTRRTRPGRLLGRVGTPALQRRALWQLFYGLALLHATAFAREHPGLTRHAVHTQLRSSLPLTRRAHVLYWFFQLGGRLRLFVGTAADADVFVLDDGFMHRAVHLHASALKEPDADEIRSYVDLLPPPDLVVFVTAPLEVCLRRVVARGIWRHSRSLTPTELSYTLLNAERAARVAVDHARRRGWHVVEVANGDDTPDRARRELGRVLLDWPACARPVFTPAASSR